MGKGGSKSLFGDEEFSERDNMDKQLNRMASSAGIPRQMRQDMAVAQDGLFGQTRGGTPVAGGKENTIIVQVRSDDQIKKLIKFEIDEDGNMKQLDAGKVVPGL